MQENTGRTVRLFLVDGVTTGLITAEIINWTGHAMVVPRQGLAVALRRDEAARTGVYFLIGEDPDQPTRSKLYIGEGDAVGERLKSHANDESKSFWTQCCLITSKDTNLTKSHVRYLESRLIDSAKVAGRVNLANAVEPPTKALPESDIADMEYFLTQLSMILPVLGFDFLRPTPSAQSEATSMQRIAAAVDSEAKNDGSTPIPLYLRYPAQGVEATALLWGNEVIVETGSTASTETHISNTYAAHRQQLIDDGRLVLDGRILRFSKDVSFASPSAAAAVILNRNSNGRTEWKLKDSGNTLKDWQEQQLLRIPQITFDEGRV